MADVRRKLDAVTVADPMGGAPGDDPWRAFREIEFLDFPMQFQFRHSLGKLSRFFLALEERRLLATRCPRCGQVWMPPRVVCPDDLAITDWVEVPGRGTLEAAVLSAYTTKTDGGTDQLVLGYVSLEGTSTLLLQQIRGYGDPAQLAAGLPVRAVWSQVPVDHPMELFWFEPAP